MLEVLEHRQLLTTVSTKAFEFAGTDQHYALNLTAAPAGSLASALQVWSLTNDTNVPMNAGISSNGGTSITWATVDTRLLNGWYEAHVTSPHLQPQDIQQTFAFVDADFNGDRVTNFNDYMVMQNNFGSTSTTFAQGDADYNGTVNFDDFMILQNNFGASLPALPTQAGGVVVGNAMADALDVGWTAGNEPRDGFKIYRSTDGVNFSYLDTVPDANARSYRDSDVTNGVKYWYRVRAYTNAAGASVSVTKAWGIATQPTPIATGLAAAGIGPGRIALLWKAPADTAVVAYRVYRSQTPGFLPSAATLVTETDQRKTKIIDSGLSPGHTYYYKVVAVGANGSTSLPSAEVAAVAQNQGPGLSNNGTPFNPQTHDSDNDGTPDAQDTDNDNDGITDEADSDDDNDGTSDNAEPDDRDSDGDGQSDNDDSDDDNDGTPDTQDEDDDDDGTDDEDDASTGDNNGVPTGPGTFTIFDTHRHIYVNDQKDYLTEGYTPDYIDFSYDKEEDISYDEDPYDDYEEPPVMVPKRSFSESDANSSQTFTLRNVPKHALISVDGTIYGNGIYTELSPDFTGEISVRVNGEELDVSGGYGWMVGNTIRFGGTIESGSDTVTIELKGQSFSEGGYWNIHALSVAAVLPAVSISADTSAIEEDEHEKEYNEQTGEWEETSDLKKIKFTVTRSGPAVGDLEVPLDWDTGTADNEDASGLKSNVTIPDGQSSVDFEVSIKDDDEAEGVESLIAKIKKGDKFAVPAAFMGAVVAVDDNVSVKSITVETNPDIKFGTSYSYLFKDIVRVKGEHLDKVRITQLINASTTIIGFDGVVLSSDQLKPAFENYKATYSPNATVPDWNVVDSGNKFVVDTGWNKSELEIVKDSKGGEGIAGDTQQFFVFLQGQTADGTDYYGKGSTTKYFKVQAYLGETDKKLGDEFSWGYKWNNYISTWQDNPPVPSCVKFKVGFDKGTFSDIQGITGLP